MSSPPVRLLLQCSPGAFHPRRPGGSEEGWAHSSHSLLLRLRSQAVLFFLINKSVSRLSLPLASPSVLYETAPRHLFIEPRTIPRFAFFFQNRKSGGSFCNSLTRAGSVIYLFVRWGVFFEWNQGKTMFSLVMGMKLSFIKIIGQNTSLQLSPNQTKEHL